MGGMGQKKCWPKKTYGGYARDTPRGAMGWKDMIRVWTAMGVGNRG